MKKLEVQFRQQGKQWQLRLVPERSGIELEGWRNWEPPRPEQLERKLLLSLFNTDAALPLLREPWHLRLRPETWGDPAGIPSVPWSYLVHPDYAVHILDLEWTATELVEVPRSGVMSGRIVVVGDEALAGDLRRRVGPVVQSAGLDEVPDRSILVVSPKGMSESVARDADERWYRKKCPLAVWCNGFEPPRGSVPAIVSAGEPEEPENRWLTRLLVKLLNGLEPTVAFAEAGRAGPPKDRFVRGMRGAHDKWTVPDTGAQLTLPPHWYIYLDRSKQEAHVNNLFEGLLGSPRRVQMVLSSGPDGAGLDLFRQRPPRLLRPLPLIEWEVGWADNPARTVEELVRMAHADGPLDLPHRLQEIAARSAGGALFLIRHATASLTRNPDAIQVTREELKAYCDDLKRLAGQLVTTNVRVFVHVSVAQSTAEELGSMREKTPYFLVDVLKTLDPGVPQDELENWLTARNLDLTAEELHQLQGLNYDELIERILQRHAGLLGV